MCGGAKARARGRVLAGGVALSVLAALLAATVAPQRAEARQLLVVQSNVGNVNIPGCAEHVFKLCLRPVEERAAAELQALSPDLVAFQEILPPALCDQRSSSNPSNLCSAPLAPRSQVRRLLGPGYRFACDRRYAWDCLAVRREAGRITDFETRPVLEGCEDDGFTMNAATLRIRGWPLSVTTAHPDSMDAACRAAQVRDLLEGALPRRGPALVPGDWNLDPFRDSDESVAYWKTVVPDPFRLLSDDTLTWRPNCPSQLDPTGEALDGDACAPSPLPEKTLDHVLARGPVGGACEARRIDGGGGFDHWAQVCRVEIGPRATPRMRVRRNRCGIRVRFRPRPGHLLGVRFRVAGGRARTDRRPPHRIRPRGRERSGRPRVTIRPILTTGPGPKRTTRFRRCARG